MGTTGKNDPCRPPFSFQEVKRDLPGGLYEKPGARTCLVGHMQSDHLYPKNANGRAENRVVLLRRKHLRISHRPMRIAAALSRRPPRGTTHHTDYLVGSLGLSCVLGARRRSPRTATQATKARHEEHRNALDGNVLQKTPVLAMA